MLVDMNHVVSIPTDLFDDLHPYDQGYHKIGLAWFQALKLVNNLGWISQPIVPGV